MIGAGVSGLAAATYLSNYPGVDVTILERNPRVGGRADVVGNAEHCQRLFIDDYSMMFDLLRQIPSETGTVYESLRPVSRMVHVDGQWRRISRLYAIWSRELTFWEKYRVINERRTSPLLGERAKAHRKSLRMLRNFDLRTFGALVWASKRPQGISCLPGRTDECLTLPWLRFLENRGVRVNLGTPAARLYRARGHASWSVEAGSAELTFDAVITTLLPDDLAALLDASNLAHRLPRNHEHLNFKTLTFDFDDLHPDDNFPEYALMAKNGVSVFLQRPEGRCTAFCTSPLDATDEYIIEQVRNICGARGLVRLVGTRENADPSEVIYCARQIQPSSVLLQHHRGLYFAGSAMAASYPVDSGEAATRAAREAVDQLLADTNGRTQNRIPGPLASTSLFSLARHSFGRRCGYAECDVCDPEATTRRFRVVRSGALAHSSRANATRVGRAR